MSEEEIRHFSAILERVEDNVRLLAEGHGSLEKRLDGIEGKVDGIEGKVDRLGDDMSFMRADVAVLKGDVAVLKGDVAVLKTDMHRVKDHLDLNGAAKPRATKKRSKKR